MNGVIKGSIIHIHRARTVVVDSDGMITASELGTLSRHNLGFIFILGHFLHSLQHVMALI